METTSVYPKLDYIMESERPIVGFRDLVDESVYCVVNRREIAGCCVCTLRNEFGDLFDVWTTVALRKAMVQGVECVDLPVWLGLPKIDCKKRYIHMVLREFSDKDYAANQWAVKVRSRNIAPVRLTQIDQSEDSGNETCCESQVKRKKASPVLARSKRLL